MPVTKVCQRCHKRKRVTSFYANLTKPDKLNGICKKCQKEVDRLNRKQ